MEEIGIKYLCCDYLAITYRRAVDTVNAAL
jgi:hypothetical protein